MSKIITIDDKKYCVDDSWTPNRISEAEQEIVFLKRALSHYMTDSQIKEVVNTKVVPIEELPELESHLKKVSN